MKRWQNYVALFIACVALQGCADSSDDSTAGNDGAKLTLSKVTPANGSKGTVVALEGAKFEQGMEVCFANACGKAEVTSATAAKIAAPEGKGTVDVCVKSGSEQSCLSNAFIYAESSTATCNADGVKCSDDKQSLITCKDKVETTKPCPNGCENNACRTNPDPSTNPDPGQSTSPAITGMSPVSGKSGTEVTVTGNNLEATSKVCFGLTCVDPKSKEKTSVKAVAPDGTGIVTISIKINDKTINAGNFTYLVDTQEANVVDWCQLTYVETPVVAGTAIQAYAQVYKAGITGKEGTHAGLEGEFGYIKLNAEGSSDLSNYRWVKAVRNDKFQGEAAQNNDEFMLTDLKLDVDDYRVAYRFSLNKGEFLYCDGNGSQDGFSIEKAPVISVKEKAPDPAKTVAWCQIIGPDSLRSEVGKDTEYVYAQAYVEGCTNYQNNCADLKAQIGYVTAANAPDESKVKWAPAVLNDKYDGSIGKDHDEFMAKLKSDEPGEYKVVYRMSVDDAKTWTYCDAQNNNTFSYAEGTTWNVTSPEQPATKIVDWCEIHYPKAIEAHVGDAPTTVYGRVHVADCTGADKGEVACDGLEGRLLLKPKAPTTGEPKTFNATFNLGARENTLELAHNDEFMVDLPIPETAGQYEYFYQFKGKDDTEWKSCNTRGVDADGKPVFDESAPGTLSVTVKRKFERSNDLNCGFAPDLVTAVTGNTVVNNVSAGLYWKDKTEGKGAAIPEVKAMTMYYIAQDKAAEKPAETNLDEWSHAVAVLSGNVGNNQIFVANATFDTAGKYAYVFAVDLVSDPGNAAEVPEKLFCYKEWKESGYGEIEVTAANAQ